MDFNGVVTTVAAALILKVIEKVLDAKNQASGETLTAFQIRRQKILKTLQQILIAAAVIISLASLEYLSLQSKYFPRIEGCVESSKAKVYEIPWGNESGPLSKGCYFFDRQNTKGDWLRISDPNENLNGKWIQTSLVKIRLCKIEPGGKNNNLFSCIFPQK